MYMYTFCFMKWIKPIGSWGLTWWSINPSPSLLGTPFLVGTVNRDSYSSKGIYPFRIVTSNVAMLTQELCFARPTVIGPKQMVEIETAWWALCGIDMKTSDTFQTNILHLENIRQEGSLRGPLFARLDKAYFHSRCTWSTLVWWLGIWVRVVIRTRQWLILGDFWLAPP